MKRLFLPLLFVAGLSHAESPEILIQQLTTSVRAELNDPHSDSYRQGQILETLVSIKVNSVEGKPRPGREDDFLGNLERLASSSTSKATQDLCQTLAKQTQNVITERQTAAVENIKKRMPETIRAALAAKTSRDLDALIAVASAVLADGEIAGSKDPAHRAIVQAVYNANRFFCELQDYLASLGHEAPFISAGRWRNIVSLPEDFSMFLPRSEVLAGLEEFQRRIAPTQDRKALTQEEFEKRSREIAETAQSPDDLERVNTQLAALMRSDEAMGLYSNTVPRLVSTLREYARTYAAAKSGKVRQGDVESIVTNQPELRNDALLALSNRLLLVALPPLLQVSDQAADGETPVAYLQRLTERAVSAADWDLLARALDMMTIVHPHARNLVFDRLAVQAFLVGLNQERARQYALAVKSYRKALGASSQMLKPELVGDRLEKLRQEHPEAFDPATPPPSPPSNKSGARSASSTTPSWPPLFPDYTKGWMGNPSLGPSKSPPTPPPTRPARQ